MARPGEPLRWDNDRWRGATVGTARWGSWRRSSRIVAPALLQCETSALFVLRNHKHRKHLTTLLDGAQLLRYPTNLQRPVSRPAGRRLFSPRPYNSWPIATRPRNLWC